jgi:nicotinamide riboside kinase
MEKNLKQLPTKIIKIALFGPESTGKTTLASQLADELATTWIPEFARDYLQQKWNASQEKCTPDDLLPIAMGQVHLENEALTKANQLLICDTNVLQTKVFSDMYYNYSDPMLEKAARKHKYDLVFLTDVDTPWEKDDLRDCPQNRIETLAVFEKALIDKQQPYIKLSGSKSQRLAKATQIVTDFVTAKKLGLTAFDYLQIYDKSLPLNVLESQFEIIKNGIPKINLERPATLKDGILPLSEEEAIYYATFFDQKKSVFKLKKFVPASGAASRMFKFLSEFLNEFHPSEETINAYINRKNDKSLPLFLVAKEKFPFYDVVLEATKKTFDHFENWSKDLQDVAFIQTLLSKSAFDYANKPKGVLPFHQYVTHTATAIEEHLNECAFYAVANKKSQLHFTVSEEHQSSFEAIISSVKTKIEQQKQVTIDVSFSYQDPSTDVIAVDLNNHPFRDEDGNLIFRPGGHGALIENLNHLNADIVFIKNIDNVIQNHIETITLYKKALGGILILYQEALFGFLKSLDQEIVSTDTIQEVVHFLNTTLNISLIDDFFKYTKDSKIDYLKNMLNRPIRVCGMVKNEGEPGGGPFWVTDKKGNTFLQIIEEAQIDFKNDAQVKISEGATHFNPVDLVCGIKDYRGQNFDLRNFVNPNTGFIVEKNKNGKPYKAYELPGLWNGAMAKWLTVFVEVPLITFNPVKTVNDLLKPAHQP